MERVGIVSRIVVGGMRGVVNKIPQRWRKMLEDRIFYAIFQSTRVTNDAYGAPGGPAGGARQDDAELPP